MPQPDPTVALLLHLARVELSAGVDEEVAKLAARADWPELTRLAIRGGIAGLIVAHSGRVAMPRRAVHALAAHSLATEAQNRALLAHALNLCGSAEAQGLTLVPLKGIALQVAGIYPQPGMRAQCDIDLLTERSQIDAVDALLRQAGFVYRGDPGYALRHQHHLKYVLSGASGSHTLVELHWTPFFVTYGQPTRDAAALRRTSCRTWCGQAVRMLDPIDMLLSVSLHLAVHRYRAALKWLVDVAELARHQAGTSNAAELWQRADALGARRALGRVFGLATALLTAPLPATSALGPLGWLLARQTPALALITSADQPSLPVRLAIDLLQSDHPWSTVVNTGAKLAELIERRGGPRFPWTRAGTAGRSGRGKGSRRRAGDAPAGRDQAP